MALAILAISAISLLAATQAHVSRIGGLEGRVLAQFVAENRLAELELGIADEAAPVVMLGRAFRIETSALGDRGPGSGADRLSVADGERVQSFTGFVATPPKPAEAP